MHSWARGPHTCDNSPRQIPERPGKRPRHELAVSSPKTHSRTHPQNANGIPCPRLYLGLRAGMEMPKFSTPAVCMNRRRLGNGHQHLQTPLAFSVGVVATAQPFETARPRDPEANARPGVPSRPRGDAVLGGAGVVMPSAQVRPGRGHQRRVYTVVGGQAGIFMV